MEENRPTSAPKDPPGHHGSSVLEYLEPPSATDKPVFPNAAANIALFFSLLPGASLFILFCDLGDQSSLVAALAWPISSVAAIVFGVIGFRRSRTVGVKGRAAAIVGLLLGILGLTVLGINVVGNTIALRYYGPSGPLVRSQCTTNLRDIHAACMSYAKKHGGQYPLSLEELVKAGELLPHQLLCPVVRQMPQSPTLQSGQFSYIYLGRALTTASSASSPVACDRLENHAKSGLNVLYADGRVVWLPSKDAAKFLRRCTSKPAPAGAD